MSIASEPGQRRAVIEAVFPEIDSGRFPIKRTMGERVVVEADIFGDGHDILAAVLKYRPEEKSDWLEVPMQPLVNDRWRASFLIAAETSYRYTIEAWIDHFASWRRDFQKKIAAAQDVGIGLLSGAELIEDAARRAGETDSRELRRRADELRNAELPDSGRIALALEDSLAQWMARYPDRRHSTVYEKELRILVDPERARFSSWYEIFPRSCGAAGRHGTFLDCEAQLNRIARMGFDVLYLPPIHPVGKSFRKGKNNDVISEPDDVGSPWAIGSREGGHKSVHPELGTLEEFRQLVRHARERGIEIALDIAFQCSPDHPYVTEHPEWFRKRPDGSIQYAENPPKKYQDIVPFDFESNDWENMWLELKSIFDFWIAQGVTIYRVDNPHTKAFPFWEWCIGELKREHPGLIFLSEAFTRPKVLKRLAKLGFTQSYNYFPWRNTKHELTEYLTELTHGFVSEYLRPNLWPNTPDILTEYFQHGGRPAFVIRLILAATLGASYGIYGPAFELCENIPREPGGEEYLNSEKYQLRQWDLKSPDSLEDLIAAVNRIRKENTALQFNHSLRFHNIDNPQIIAYSKTTADGSNTILVVVNLDPHHSHFGWLELPLEEFGISEDRACQMHDLLTHARYLWSGRRNYVELNPQNQPAHIFRLRRRTRSEQDFDYYL